jgi:DNA-binding response OmpR family regulator
MKILYIEDDPTSSRLVSMHLRVGGHMLITARDAREGLRLAYRERPDVILLDYQLPGIDGLQAVDLLKTTDRLVNTPVIAVTAAGTAADGRSFIAAGCDGFVPKPINGKALLAEIDRVSGAQQRV